MRIPRLAASLAALLVLAGCSSNDIDCLGDFNHDDPECLSDAVITIEDAGGYIGKTVEVTVSSSSRSTGRSGTIGASEVRFVFTDFVREGGGPYTVKLHIDLDRDGACDDPPVDAGWSETFDDDDTEWVMDLGNGMDPICL